MPSRVRKYDFLVDFLVGMSDGLVIPFAVVTGLSVSFPPAIIVSISLLLAVAIALAMSLSRYFSAKNPVDDARLHEIVSSLRVGESTRELIIEEAKKTNDEWQSITDELDDPETIVKSAAYVGFSYLLAGTIPVIPLLVIADDAWAVRCSMGCSLLALAVLGYAKGKLTGQSGWFVAGKTLVAGALVALAAYSVARVFA